MRLAADGPTIADLVAGFRSRERSVVDTVEEALARVDATEPYLSAFTLVTADRARVEARALDADAAAGHWRGPLHGVPLVVKDLYDIDGELTGAGSRIPPTRHLAGRDADAVARLRSAGAVVLGRTRTHEYAWGLTTQHPRMGGARNPLDTARVPGGSSGGSAAAVAAGDAPVGLAPDTAGSIRLPAAWCGLVGHKPTHGRVSLSGVVPLAKSFDHAGAITRTVADARTTLSVLVGTEMARGWRARDLDGLRIGRVTGNAAPAADQAVQATLEALLRRALDAGAEQVELTGPTWPRMRDTFYALQASEALGYHRSLGHWPRHAELYGDDVRARLQLAEQFSAEDVAAARRDLAAMRSQVKDMFAVADVVVQLVAGSGPSTVARPDQVRVDGHYEDLREQVLPHTLLASLCGLPACSFPAGVDADGLPVAVQVVGAPRADELVLDVAEALAG